MLPVQVCCGIQHKTMYHIHYLPVQQYRYSLPNNAKSGGEIHDTRGYNYVLYLFFPYNNIDILK